MSAIRIHCVHGKYCNLTLGCCYDLPSVSTTSGPCCRTTLAPVGMAMWKPMAVALGWPDRPITFKQLASLALNRTAGWSSIGPQYAAWGRFKMGHGHPATSNSGRLFVASSIFAFANLSTANGGRAGVLTPEAANSSAAFQGTFVNSATDTIVGLLSSTSVCVYPWPRRFRT